MEAEQRGYERTPRQPIPSSTRPSRVPEADDPQVGGAPGARADARPECPARRRCRRAGGAAPRPARPVTPRPSIAPTGHRLALQQADGCWEGEVVWCPMILAQYVIVRASSGRAVDRRDARRDGPPLRGDSHARRRLGAAPRGAGLRLLHGARLRGAAPARPAGRTTADAAARAWLHAQPGGVLAIPTWGKFWLALSASTTTAGINPCPARAVPPARAGAGPPRSLLLPHALHLSRHELPLRRRFRADLGPIADEPAQRALRRALRAPSTSRRTATTVADRSPRPPGMARAPAHDASWRVYERVAPARAAAARARALLRSASSTSSGEPLPGDLAGQRAPQLPGALGARSRAPRARAEPRRRGGLALGGRARRASASPARARTPGTPPSRCRPLLERARGQPSVRTRCAAPTASWRRPSSREELPTARPPSARPDPRRLVLLRRRAPLAGERLHRRGAVRDPARCTTRAGWIPPAERDPDERLRQAAALHPRAPERRRRLRHLRAPARLAAARSA